MECYCKRGDASENRIKDLKIGFGMEYMPCGTFQANAAFFAIGVMTYNLYLGFRGVALGKEWERAQVQCAGASFRRRVTAIRERCARLMQEGGVIPETS